MNFYSSMYAGKPKQPQEPIKQKSTVRSLSGMKVHGSHMFKVDVGDGVYNVPKMEYVDALHKMILDQKEIVIRLEKRIRKLEKITKND